MSLGPQSPTQAHFYDKNKHHKQYNIRHGFNCHVNNVADDMVIDVDDVIADMQWCGSTGDVAGEVSLSLFLNGPNSKWAWFQPNIYY